MNNADIAEEDEMDMSDDDMDMDDDALNMDEDGDEDMFGDEEENN
jgi:hypothetical protein